MLTYLLVMLGELFEVSFELFVFWSGYIVMLFGNLSFMVLEIIFECGLGGLKGFST